jgi:hypothetical protein
MQIPVRAARVSLDPATTEAEAVAAKAVHRDALLRTKRGDDVARF